MIFVWRLTLSNLLLKSTRPWATSLIWPAHLPISFSPTSLPRNPPELGISSAAAASCFNKSIAGLVFLVSISMLAVFLANDAIPSAISTRPSPNFLKSVFPPNIPITLATAFSKFAVANVFITSANSWDFSISPSESFWILAKNGFRLSIKSPRYLPIWGNALNTSVARFAMNLPIAVPIAEPISTNACKPVSIAAFTPWNSFRTAPRPITAVMNAAADPMPIMAAGPARPAISNKIMASPSWIANVPIIIALGNRSATSILLNSVIIATNTTANPATDNTPTIAAAASNPAISSNIIDALKATARTPIAIAFCRMPLSSILFMAMPITTISNATTPNIAAFFSVLAGLIFIWSKAHNAAIVSPITRPITTASPSNCFQGVLLSTRRPATVMPSTATNPITACLESLLLDAI